MRDCSDAGKLRHPHLASGPGIDLDGGRPYVASEFVDGTSLARHVRQHGLLSGNDAIRVVTQVADLEG